MIDDFVKHLGGLEEVYKWAILYGANCLNCGEPLEKMVTELSRCPEDPAEYHVYFECEKCGRKNELVGLLSVHDTEDPFFHSGKRKVKND